MKGFTLVEMMVALLVFGMVAAAGSAVLGFAADSREQVRGHTDDLGDFQRARGLMKADLQQAVARRTRDEAGRLAAGAFLGGGAGPLLALTRTGWDNPDGEPRASLQYVEYRVTEGRLERRSRPMLDGAPLGPPLVLLSGVEAAEVAFLARGEWREAWISSPAAPLPEAVRLDLTAARLGSVRQLFLVAGGAP